MLSTVLNTRWTDAANKIVKAAEEFPADKFNAKPSAEVRSVAEQLRHVAFWNDYLRDTLQGKSPRGDANEISPAKFGTKRTILAALKGSFDDVSGVISEANGKLDEAFVDNVVSYIEHNGNHYGQLAMHYRLNGLVPPSSR